MYFFKTMFKKFVFYIFVNLLNKTCIQSVIVHFDEKLILKN